jgi:aconitate hydratase
LSGNRNFPGRIHPDLDLGFIMSPPLVVAFALSGNAQADLRLDTVQIAPDGTSVFLSDLWPSREEVATLLELAADPDDYPRAFANARQNPAWHGIDAPATAQFPWDPQSNALRRPPFAAVTEGTQLGTYSAYPLLVLGDDITTDHISPASAIPKDSFVADFLVARGDDPEDLNVFASRRGNWEVMIRAAFYNKSLVNLLQPGMPVAHTLHVPSGDIKPIHEVAAQYRAQGDAVVLIAGERYGTGSSRDWAAKGQRLLGIRAVLAVSFERIHRSNLIGMGILPLRWPAGISPAKLNIQPGDKVEVSAPSDKLAPRCRVDVKIARADASVESYEVTAAVETQLEVALLRCGGVIPFILQKTLAAQGKKWKHER